MICREFWPSPNYSHHNQSQQQQKDRKQALPSVGDENIVYMTQSIASWQRTVGKFLLVQFPGERGSVEGILLLSLGSQRTTRSCAVWCVFTWYVTLAITPYYRTSKETQWSHYQEITAPTIQKEPKAKSFKGYHQMLANFMSTWYRQESLERREPQLRKRFHNIRLQASPWSIFLVNDAVGPSQLWVGGCHKNPLKAN